MAYVVLWDKDKTLGNAEENFFLEIQMLFILLNQSP